MAAEYLLERDGRPTAVIVDMPGLNDGTDTTADVLQLTARADLVLWVVSATRPARALDRRGLDALRAWANAQLTRRPPPMLLALTHVDQLHPAAEWAPPYDIVTPSTTKAEAIRSAIDAVARSLDFSPSAIVPVAMPHGLGTYNADALWARIALELDEAKLVQFDRLRVGHPAFSLRKILEQLNNAGRMIIKAIAKSQ